MNKFFTAQRLKDTAYVTVGASMRSYCQINLSQAEPMALVLLLIMFSGLVPPLFFTPSIFLF